MLKRMTVSAIAAGVVAALLLPASAPGFWTHHKTAIQQDVQLGLTGTVRFLNSLGSFECQVTSRVKFTANQTVAHVETFVPHPTGETTNCQGKGGLAFCQVHGFTPQAPNWTVATAPWTTVSGLSFPPPSTAFGEQHVFAAQVATQPITATTTGGFCPGLKHFELTSGSLGLVEWDINQIPADGATITSVEVNGALDAHLTTTNGTKDSQEILVSGVLQIEDPKQRNTYSF